MFITDVAGAEAWAENMGMRQVASEQAAAGVSSDTLIEEAEILGDTAVIVAEYPERIQYFRQH